MLVMTSSIISDGVNRPLGKGKGREMQENPKECVQKGVKGEAHANFSPFGFYRDTAHSVEHKTLDCLRRTLFSLSLQSVAA
jgi:hypothetical protein